MLKKRDLVTTIILSFVTCGIYGIVWFIGLTDDASKLNNNPDFTGGKAFLFSLLTCGIYSIYWNYKMGQELYQAAQKRNINSSDNSILYLILSLVGLGIVSYCLMQDEINKMIDAGV